jgi:hypothetical protein
VFDLITAVCHGNNSQIYAWCLVLQVGDAVQAAVFELWFYGKTTTKNRAATQEFNHGSRGGRQSMGWISDLFKYGFEATSTLGVASFAMLAVVALVALLVTLTKSNSMVIFLVAMACIVVLVIINQIYPPHRQLQEVTDGKTPPAPPPSSGNPASWFDTGLQADWGGRDSFYGAGDRPIYQSDGKTLCDDNHLGRIATCWSSRPADASSMAPDVPTNILQRRNDWCAYKSLTLATPPDGHAPPGRVYVCALSIPR